MLKRVAAIHDISCFGKCSLTVALPIISAAGVECSVIPTAVLSTHTGGFAGFTFRDLTSDILPIAEHWQGLNLNFDAVYTGFLGSIEQIDLVCELYDKLKLDGTMLFVDPVMADNGKLYSIFPQDFPSAMKKLCAKADVIMPNLTEAALLVGEEYQDGLHTKEYAERILQKLVGLGAKQAVLTGVSFDEDMLGAASFDGKEVSYNFAKKVEGYYHGTGDVFGSVLVSAVTKGLSLKEGVRAAVDFTVDCINRTKAEKTDIRFGVNFEDGLYALKRNIESGLLK